ncbi:PLDc N-terminal domain-containing protein [Echinicola sp. 20G]|uniref:PLDc N-terminal domain-containing protein n=1 Tax=Echinicola sp. 20G TaxID=2781961 RepID=UPI00190FFA56|nr:PLDc N-terminal domain-containing protein [Echinicola sp. 20G]
MNLFIINFSGISIGILAVLAIALPVWAIFDLVYSKFVGKNTKLLWIVLIFVFPFIGPLAYFIIGRRDKIINS